MAFRKLAAAVVLVVLGMSLVGAQAVASPAAAASTWRQVRYSCDDHFTQLEVCIALYRYGSSDHFRGQGRITDRAGGHNYSVNITGIGVYVNSTSGPSWGGPWLSDPDHSGTVDRAVTTYGGFCNERRVGQRYRVWTAIEVRWRVVGSTGPSSVRGFSDGYAYGQCGAAV